MSSICDVPGISVGHAQHNQALTGCTVILPANDVVAGVDIRGSAPGTREIEVLKPVRLVEKIHGILLTGGSAYGLDAAGGVQKFLEEKDVGFDTGIAKIPIVPAAVIFDLAVGDPSIRPDIAMGYNACVQATSRPPEEGRVGAGTGAMVAKILGKAHTYWGGIGTCSKHFDNDLVIGVITVVNAFGQIVNPKNRTNVLPRTDLDMLEYLENHASPSPFNTTLSVVATNASLTREQAIKLAQMSQDGLPRAINPAHTLYDGDIIFSISTGQLKADINILGAFASELVANSIYRAVCISNSIEF